MSSKKRKSLSESGAGKTFSNIEDLKRELAEEEGAGERPETGEPDAVGTSGSKGPASDTGQSGASGSTSENKDTSGGTTRMTFHPSRAAAGCGVLDAGRRDAIGYGAGRAAGGCGNDRRAL